MKTKSTTFWSICIAIMFVFSAFALSKIYVNFYKNVYPTHYSDWVTKYSQKYGVHDDLVYAVIRTESGFKTDAQSHVGARGLMQITKDTFEWAQFRKNNPEIMEYEALYNPEINIEFGTYILSLLIDEFGSEQTALAAYHAGWGNVKKWLTQEENSKDGTSLYNIPFNDTNKYVKKVMDTKNIYNKLYKL